MISSLRISHFVRIAALLGFLVGPVACRESLPSRAGSVEARLELSAGSVKVTAPDRSFDGFTGAALPTGSLIETGKGARAMARLAGGTALFLRDSSQVQIGDSGIQLVEGEVFLEVGAAEGEPARHTFGDAVLTAGEAGVAIRKEKTGSTVVVTRGAVVVTAPGGRAEAHAGEQIVIADGKLTVSAVTYWEDWTGGLADHAAMSDVAGAGSGRIYGVQLGGQVGQAIPLEIQRQSVRASIRSGIAETEVDQTFFNPTSMSLEGWFWFTVPDDALVTGFAVETDGVLVEGDFIEKTQAAQTYRAAAASNESPAILEWVNERTARARIYPVPAMGSRRVVLRYLQRLPSSDGELRYAYPMRSDHPPRIGEFSLDVDLGDEGTGMDISTLADATVEEDGRHVTMRRSGFEPRADFVLEARNGPKTEPLRVSRFYTGGDAADYLMVRYLPDIDWQTIGAQRAEVVLVVDTSGGADEAARQLQRAAAEAILRSLSAEDRFAVVSVDVGAKALHPASGLASGTDSEISQALERLSEHAHGGATDLAASFDVALELLHDGTQPAVIYLGDGLATAGARSGAALRDELTQALSTSRARLFTVGVGNDADMVMLGELAHAGGGEALRIDDTVEATERALQLAADIKAPTLTDLRIDMGAGLDEVFGSAGGKVRRGEEIVVLARSHHPLPDQIKVTGNLGGQPFERSYEPGDDDGLVAAFAPKFWARAWIDHLLGGAENPDSSWGTIARMGSEYGLLTPYSSILAVPNRISAVDSKLRGVRLVGMSATEESQLRHLGGSLAFSFGCGAEAPTVPHGPQPVSASRKKTTTEAPPPDEVTAPATTPLNNDAPSKPTATPAKAAPRFPAQAPADRQGGMAGQGAPTNSLQLQEGLERGGDLDQDGERDERRADAKQNRGWVPSDRSTCSDLSARPVADRIPLWKQRVANAEAFGIWEVVRTAQASCEVDDYRAQAVLASIVARPLRSEGLVRSFFYQPMSPTFRTLVARAILRRSTDPAVLAAVEEVLFLNQVDWVAVDRKVQETSDLEVRLRIVREAVSRAPDDPRGAIRLVRLLAKAGKIDELMLKVRSLQDQGVLTAEMATEVGDILARAGRQEDAIRAYSEMIEFDPDGVNARRLLGDIFLAHGWYDPAYRQYESLVNIADVPMHRLRMAMAAGGAGRVDEALRLERAVAAAPGAPGADDPRAWARLWSAARVASLMAAPANGEGVSDSLRRRLKELQLFLAPGTLVIVTWENLGAQLGLEATGDVSESLDGSPVGVTSVMLPAGAETTPLTVRLRSAPLGDPLRLRIHRIHWDGKTFTVEQAEKELAGDTISL